MQIAVAAAATLAALFAGNKVVQSNIDQARAEGRADLSRLNETFVNAVNQLAQQMAQFNQTLQRRAIAAAQAVPQALLSDTNQTQYPNPFQNLDPSPEPPTPLIHRNITYNVTHAAEVPTDPMAYLYMMVMMLGLAVLGSVLYRGAPAADAAPVVDDDVADQIEPQDDNDVADDEVAPPAIAVAPAPAEEEADVDAAVAAAEEADEASESDSEISEHEAVLNSLVQKYVKDKKIETPVIAIDKSDKEVTLADLAGHNVAGGVGDNSWIATKKTVDGQEKLAVSKLDNLLGAVRFRAAEGSPLPKQQAFVEAARSYDVAQKLDFDENKQQQEEEV